MNRNAAVLLDVKQYEKLRAKFAQFTTAAKKMLSAGNDKFGIAFGESDETSAAISVLHHRCRVDFTVHRSPVRMIGKLEFGRLVGPIASEETHHFLSVYFDELGNAGETPDGTGWFGNLNGTDTDITDWLAIRLLEEFFNDLAPESSPTQGKS